MGRESFVGHPAIAFGSSALPRSHHPADGLIHHRPGIVGQKLLADSLGNGVQSCAGAAGEDDAFHEMDFNKSDTLKTTTFL